MASMINVKNSAKKIRNIVRRHIRLCKQIINDVELIAQIEPEYLALDEKRQKVAEGNMEREDRYDDVILADSMLDDLVCDLFADCKQYDRAHPGERVLVQIFPDEKYGDLVRLPFVSEVKEAEKMTVRIDALSTDHELAKNKKGLLNNVKRVTDAIDAHERSIHKLKVAEAEEEIAKEKLARKYEMNYLDAHLRYGRQMADKLFPRITCSKSTEGLIEGEADENAM